MKATQITNVPIYRTRSLVNGSGEENGNGSLVRDGSPAARNARLRELDRSLIRACLAGDRQAWETLIRRYERLLYSIPLRCGLSEDDAADVFQTVCVRLLENLEKLRDEGHLTGWLITTAKHEAWRVRRQKNRQGSFNVGDPESAPDALLESLATDDPLPHEA